MQPLNDMDPKDLTALLALKALADSLEPRPEFELRLEAALKMKHKDTQHRSRFPEILRYAGWAAAIVALALFLNWLIGSLAPQRIPAAGPTSNAPTPAYTPTPLVENSGESLTYTWRGTTLTIKAALPSGPAEASVFETQPEGPTTLESAQSLAVRLGIQGSAYQPLNDVSAHTGYIITDGKQRLFYRSDQFFTYHPDYPAFLTTAEIFPFPDAEAQIAAFLSAHGLDFAYKVQPSEFFGGYYAMPLTEDGAGIRYEYFQYSGLLFRFNRDGIAAVEARLVNRKPVGVYPIRTAQEALDWLLTSDSEPGIQEGMHSSTGPFPTWYRQYPDDTTITLYAQPPSSFAAVDGSAPLVTLEGYPLLGAGELPEGFASPNMVRATGKFTRESGIRYFQVDSWEMLPKPQEGFMGTLQQQDGQGTLVTIEGETFSVPDLPADLTLPMENVYVVGYRDGSVLQWNSFNTQGFGGGGGGGGGLGLYTLNLSGTPIPFPTATPATTQLSPGSGFPYTVVAGDTFASIAQMFGLTAEELMQHNGITDPGTLYIGQTLLIPRTERAEGWQGLLSITIIKSPDGSERTQYTFMDSVHGYYQLDGSLGDLSAYQNRPIKVWGAIREEDPTQGMLISVEKYEVPYPDLKFSLLHGRQENQTVNGELLTVLTAEDGQTYVVLLPEGSPSSYPVDPGSEDVIVEVLAIPGETYAGYPALRIFSSALAINPKTNAPFDLTITADRVNVIEAPPEVTPEIPTIQIESIELIFYTKDPTSAQTSSPAYIQPMWLFTGHYSNGDEFEIMVQALSQEYLSPVVEPIEPPG